MNFGGHLGQSVVTQHQARTGDPQLSNRAVRDRIFFFVEHQQAGVGRRLADGARVNFCAAEISLRATSEASPRCGHTR